MTGIGDIPPFHVCQSLTAENEVLNNKYNKLKRKYKELYQEMLEVKEKLIRVEIHEEYKGLQNEMSVQHQGKNRKKVLQQQKTIADKTNRNKEDDNNAAKLVTLYDNLMKRYEIEVKLNRNQTKKINKLEAEKEKLKDDIFKREEENVFIHKQLKDRDEQLKSISSLNNNTKSSRQALENKIHVLTKDRERLMKENSRLKEELHGLDAGFFEELEDMKYALHQSNKLNHQYERTLKKLCKQTGMNYKHLMAASTSAQTSDGKRKSSTPTATSSSVGQLSNRKSRQSNLPIS
ncbi:centrosomal protein of 290 kDa-like isoform X2 [Clytia hemisphaerica]|uniref:Uncharacterized protein n=1 Tax=Clytia hemisphaerica TaxID=252671 RepID=A0A7M5V3N0_9CNID